VGSGGRGGRPPPEAAEPLDAEAPRPKPRVWRVARFAAASLVLVVLAAALWWFAVDRRRSASDRNACRNEVEDSWVRGGSECLHMQVYRSAAASPHPDLVVVLHGDAPFANPSYQYAAARRIATGAVNLIAVGILRPGYTDVEGRRSSGIRGRAIGDNYTPAVVDAVAGAVDQLTQSYLPARVFLVGHSGGAAIAGDVIARHPGLVNGAVLVSCPCDVPRWRQHMDSAQHTRIWRIPVQSLSPLDLAARVDPHTAVRVIVGSADPVAPPALSRAYVDRLRAHGVRAQLTEIPGAGHDILLDPRVISEITDLLAPTSGDTIPSHSVAR
jgi:pimeloyl-ACP methyl ester carboxylesterase